MREYELTVVYDLAVMEAGGPDASTEKLTAAVKARGGEVVRIDHWGRRRMAYPIGRAIDADYVVSRVNLEPDAVAPLEAALRIDEKVYRHLVVRADELPVPAPPREQRSAEAPATPPAGAAEAASAAQAVANAEALTSEQLATPAAPESAPPMDTPLRDATPETSTTGFASNAAVENSGVSVESLESHGATGPHTEQDNSSEETTA
ncbi:MAG: 30S ribosomal protein S6 [Dehalococcoidia bacterium]|nr:30S ribosomal protein S6 [Dehalococcoidia bacterium]